MVKLTTTGVGPGNCEWHITEQIELLMSQPEGWLVYNTHGLEEEGWGPIRASYLEQLLGQLVSKGVEVLPAGAALGRADAQQTS